MTKISRRSTILLAASAGLGAGLAGATASTAHAAYYNEYTTVASIPDASGCGTAQGFAAGSTYLYAVKIRASDDGLSLIYRTNKDTGATEIMTNGTDNTKTNTWLGHANDMTIVDIDSQHHLFVVTLKDGAVQLVKLRYDGATYYKVGSYAVQLDGTVKSVSGISKVTQDSSKITFMIKSGRALYTATLPLRANSGTIALTKICDLKVEGALVDGSPVTDLSTYLNQGFFYDTSKHDVYYPLTKGNRSIVLVYHGVTTASTGELSSDPNLSFRITSSAFPRTFEIESVGLSGGKLYFSTNRSKADSTAESNYDGVHYFNGYTVG